MFSRRITVGAVAVGAVAASVLGVTAANAATPTSVTVSAGGGSGTINFSVSSGSIALKDLTTQFTGSCTSSSLSGGTVKTGSQGPNGTPAGTGIAQIPGAASTSTFSGCKAVLGSSGVSFPLTLAGQGSTSNPWRVKADQTSTPTSSSPVSGQSTVGTVYNINVKVTDASSPSSCNFTVTGSISGATFKNGSPSTLTLPAKSTAADSNLTVSNYTLTNGASSCIGGAVGGNGDKISFATVYNLASNPGPIFVNAV